MKRNRMGLVDNKALNEVIWLRSHVAVQDEYALDVEVFQSIVIRLA